MSREECDEQYYVIDKLAKLLAEIAIIVNGPEPPLTRWSYHDLPDKVRALKQAPPAALAAPLFLLHTGTVYGNERGDWEVEANSGKAVDAYCDANPGKTVGLYLATQAPPAALADAAALAARLDKTLGCHADSMPKEAYFEVDAVMRALQAQQPAALAGPADRYTVDAVAWEEFIADWRQYVAGDPKMPFFRVREGLVAVIDSAQQAQQPAAAVPEVLCTRCGQPTMHMGSMCYGCTQAGMLAAERKGGES